MQFQDIVNWTFERLRGPKPAVETVNGQPYALKPDGTLGEPVRELAPQFVKPVLSVSTLSGMVEAFKAGLDGVASNAKVAFHVVSPTQVDLVSLEADDFGRRHVWAQAVHRQDCPFRFDVYMDTEPFLIAFRASFLFNDNAVKIQRVLSSLSNESAVTVADDGISQTVTAKAGAVTRTAIELPPEIPLIYWRTFREVNPVESKFLLRMKGDSGKVPQAALFEIDAKWKLDTVESVRHYLHKALPTATILA